MKLNSPGFSLIELTVVFSVIFIISALTYPSFNNYLKNYDLKNATKQFIGHLKLAQQYTVTEQIKYSLKMDVDQNSYRLLKKGQPDVLIDSFFIDEQIYFSQIDGLKDNETVFNPMGAVDYPGDVFLTHQTTGLITKIIIKPSGYVAWENYQQ